MLPPIARLQPDRPFTAGPGHPHIARTAEGLGKVDNWKTRVDWRVPHRPVTDQVGYFLFDVNPCLKRVEMRRYGSGIPPDGTLGSPAVEVRGGRAKPDASKWAW